MTKKRGGQRAQGKAEDAGGLTPAKDGNAAMRPLYPRAFARNSDDCYKVQRESAPPYESFRMPV